MRTCWKLLRDVPAPMPCAGVFFPRAELVPHSNQASVANPLGFTVPFNSALLVVTAVAGAVDASGGTGSFFVKNVLTLPAAVPAPFAAATR